MNYLVDKIRIVTIVHTTQWLKQRIIKHRTIIQKHYFQSFYYYYSKFPLKKATTQL